MLMGPGYGLCGVLGKRLAHSIPTLHRVPLVRLDVRTFDQNVVPTPRRLHGSSAISVSREDALFFGPYKEKRSILAWHSGGEISSVGAHSGPLRGLRGGRFLTHGTSGFTIVEWAAQDVRPRAL